MGGHFFEDTDGRTQMGGHRWEDTFVIPGHSGEDTGCMKQVGAQNAGGRPWLEGDRSDASTQVGEHWAEAKYAGSGGRRGHRWEDTDERTQE